MAIVRYCLRAVVYASLHLISILQCSQAFYDYPRQADDGPEEGEGEEFEDNFTSTTAPPTTMPPGPILSGSAIANIICGVLAVAFLTGYLCYLMYTFNKSERKSRVKTALENNRRIDEQIARAKARAAKQRTQDLGALKHSGDSQSELMASPSPASIGVEGRTSNSQLA